MGIWLCFCTSPFTTTFNTGQPRQIFGDLLRQATGGVCITTIISPHLLNQSVTASKIVDQRSTGNFINSVRTSTQAVIILPLAVISSAKTILSPSSLLVFPIKIFILKVCPDHSIPSIIKKETYQKMNRAGTFFFRLHQ